MVDVIAFEFITIFWNKRPTQHLQSLISPISNVTTSPRGRDRNDPSEANWRSTSFAAFQIFNSTIKTGNIYKAKALLQQRYSGEPGALQPPKKN